MKFKDSETIDHADIKNNKIYLFGNHKKSWLGYFDGESFFAIISHDKKSKIQFAQVSLLLETEFHYDEFEKAISLYSKDYFTTFCQKILNKRVCYTGAVLTVPASNILKNAFSKLLPDEWSLVCHHMTICLGELNDYPDVKIGQNALLNVESYAIDIEKGVMAAKVSTSLPSNSNFKHITLAISPDGKASDSNSLDCFLPIEHFCLEARVSSILNDGTII